MVQAQPDIPTKWGAAVTADTTPLVAYPRPQMVRGTAVSNATKQASARAHMPWASVCMLAFLF